MNQPKEKKYHSLKEFYPYYLGEHSNSICRMLHVVGTLSAIVLTFIFVLQGNYILLPLVFIVAYGLAWIGHFVFEKNRPATFQYPLYSFICDFLMLKDVLSGEIKINSSKK